MCEPALRIRRIRTAALHCAAPAAALSRAARCVQIRRLLWKNALPGCAKCSNCMRLVSLWTPSDLSSGPLRPALGEPSAARPGLRRLSLSCQGIGVGRRHGGVRSDVTLPHAVRVRHPIVRITAHPGFHRGDNVLGAATLRIASRRPQTPGTPRISPQAALRRVLCFAALSPTAKQPPPRSSLPRPHSLTTSPWLHYGSLSARGAQWCEFFEMSYFVAFEPGSERTPPASPHSPAHRPPTSADDPLATPLLSSWRKGPPESPSLSDPSLPTHATPPLPA